MPDTPKKPPAPSATGRAGKSDLKAQIVEELYVALDLVDADELRDIIANWQAVPLSDEQVLAELKEHNAKRRRPQ